MLYKNKIHRLSQQHKITQLNETTKKQNVVGTSDTLSKI